jgi:hypothetical protein
VDLLRAGYDETRVTGLSGDLPRLKRAIQQELERRRETAPTANDAARRSLRGGLRKPTFGTIRLAIR